MQPEKLRQFMRKQVESVCDDYVKDLEALSHDQLAYAPSPQARSAYDFTYEVAFVNRRWAARMSGQSIEPWPFEDFVRAPLEFHNKQNAIEEIRSSCQAVIDAWEAVPDTELDREISTGTGTTNPMDLMFMAAYHTGYHDAQLNYLQTLLGDGAMHWSES